MTPWILLTIAAVALLLHAEYRGSRAGIWTWKPIASTGFVAIKRVGSSSLGLSVSSEIVLFDPAGLASLIDVPRSRD